MMQGMFSTELQPEFCLAQMQKICLNGFPVILVEYQSQNVGIVATVGRVYLRWYSTGFNRNRNSQRKAQIVRKKTEKIWTFVITVYRYSV